MGSGCHGGLFFGEHERNLALGGAVNARVGPAFFPVIEKGLRLGQRLKTPPFQRRLLGVADTAFHLPLAVWIADTAGHSDGAVMGEHIAVEGIDFGIVDVGTQDAFGEIVEHDIFGRSAKAAEGGFVQFRPGLRTGLEAQQPDAFAAESEC